MVGAMILDPGIVARTPDEPTSLPSATADGGVPGNILDEYEPLALPVEREAPVSGPMPAALSTLDLSYDVFLRAQDSNPVEFVEWLRRYAVFAQAEAQRAALASAVQSTVLDPLARMPEMTIAAPSPPPAKKPPAARHAAPRHVSTRPAPRPVRDRIPHARPSPAPRGGWNVAPIVTWYGPGFYGHHTACGQRYTIRIIGVAHRTLPCGTLIQFQWNGMTAVAPVIDRGPYASAAYVFDWSAALACRVFKPKGVSNGCFTRHDVRWRIVGRRRH
jgi:Lytic transglycolase